MFEPRALDSRRSSSIHRRSSLSAISETSRRVTAPFWDLSFRAVIEVSCPIFRPISQKAVSQKSVSQRYIFSNGFHKPVYFHRPRCTVPRTIKPERHQRAICAAMKNSDFPNSHRREATGCPAFTRRKRRRSEVLRGFARRFSSSHALYHRTTRHLLRDRRRRWRVSLSRGLRVQFAMDGE